MIILPKKISYEVAEGYYRGRLHDVLEIEQSVRGRPQNSLRIVLAITSLQHPRFNYRAGKNYILSRPEKLADDLDSWLGDELVPLLEENGSISIEALKALVGREVDFEIEHISNGDFDTAFRHIVRLLPPGSLVVDQDAA